MTVYIDDMYKTSMGRFGRMKMSHMIADTKAELLQMADRIGVARKWLQKPGTPDEHFDVSQGCRDLAIAAGAVPITLRQTGAMVMLRRMGLPMGDPSTAWDRLTQAVAERAD